MGALLQLGFVTANIIRTLSWKTVQKRFPSVSKKLFNQIKQYKNKKNLKNAFDKSKPKPKTQPKKVDPKPKTQPKKVDPKPQPKKVDSKPKWYSKDKSFYAGAWNTLPNSVKEMLKLNIGVPGTALNLKNLPPITRTIAKSAVVYPGIPAAYGAVKNVGTKLFQGGNKKTTDISNEVTGGGTTTGDKNNTTSQVAGAGGTGVNDFVAAHNSAMDSGQQFFRFDGKMYSVGKTRMSDF